MVKNKDIFFEKMRQRFLKKGAVAVLASGGVDSTVALYAAKEFCDSVKAIEFHYDKRPAIETERTRAILDKLDIKPITVTYPIINEQNQERSFKESNALYYLIAGDIAKKNNIEHIVAGQIKDDYTHFDAADATPEYYKQLNKLMRYELGTNGPQILTPFLDLNKTEVILFGLQLGIPFDLTYSCDSGPGPEPCNSCYQCKTRTYALNQAKKILEK